MSTTSDIKVTVRETYGRFFNGHLLRQYASNQKTIGYYYDSPRQYLNFNGTDFWYS